MTIALLTSFGAAMFLYAGIECKQILPLFTGNVVAGQECTGSLWGAVGIAIGAFIAKLFAGSILKGIGSGLLKGSGGSGGAVTGESSQPKSTTDTTAPDTTATDTPGGVDENVGGRTVFIPDTGANIPPGGGDRSSGDVAAGGGD